MYLQNIYGTRGVRGIGALLVCGFYVGKID